MGDKKGRRVLIVVLSVFAFILVYFLAFAQPLSPELTAVPRWRVDLALGKGEAPAGGLMAFSVGDRYGYFTADGGVAFMAEAPGGAAISDDAYIAPAPASQKAGSRSLATPDGRTVAAVVGSYPFFYGDRLFAATADGIGVSSFDGQGARLWTYSFPCQLSAFAVSPALVVGGTIDGWLEGVRPDGSQAFAFAPGGSAHAVILGAAVSRSGAWVASVSGIDRQRLVVLSRGGSDYRVASHRYLDSDYREPVEVVIMDDERHVLYRRPDGIGVWSVDGKVDEVLPVKADRFDVAMDEGKGVSYIAARRGAKSEVAVFMTPGTLLGRVSMPDSSDYLRFEGSSVFLGGRDWLARFDFVEE